ncbi:hypothetical protein IWQ56_006015 [Coemansia nantahalensis]|nr:hypothetical protein IWQ56_006015 [Coemansia nantahalensis]
MTMDPFGMNGFSTESTAAAAAVAVAAATQQQQQQIQLQQLQQQQQQQQALASMGVITANALTSDVTLVAKTAAASTLAEAAMAATPSQLQPASNFSGDFAIDPSSADPLIGGDSLALFQTQGLLDAQPPTPSVGSSTTSLSGGVP